MILFVGWFCLLAHLDQQSNSAQPRDYQRPDASWADSRDHRPGRPWLINGFVCPRYVEYPPKEWYWCRWHNEQHRGCRSKWAKEYNEYKKWSRWSYDGHTQRCQRQNTRGSGKTKRENDEARSNFSWSWGGFLYWQVSYIALQHVFHIKLISGFLGPIMDDALHLFKQRAHGPWMLLFHNWFCHFSSESYLLGSHW